MDAPWRIQLLGGLRAVRGDRAVSRFRSQKTGALFAYLAYHRAHAHPRELLIEIFWPESEPEAGRHSLSMALSSLRHQLEPPGTPQGAVIVADRTSVRLDPTAVTTDVAEFEAALRGAQQARGAGERADFLAEAVGLYAGLLLPGHYEDWIVSEQQRLAEAYFQAALPLMRHWQDRDELGRAVDLACRAVSIDPLREEPHYELMRLYRAAGQPAAALRQYRSLERILGEQLGETPSPSARQLAEELERAIGVQALGRSGVQAGDDGGPPTEAPTPLEAEGLPASAWGDHRPRAETPEGLNARTPERLAPPTGTVTFLLTDIEDSTALWERTGDAYPVARAAHCTLLREEFERHGGYEFKELGDGFMVAFGSVGDAVACAIDAQRALAAPIWPAAIQCLAVRMAIHTGDVELEKGDYQGLTLHQAARMSDAARGGQILCSQITAGLLRRGGARGLEPDVRLTELGVYRLRGIDAPERLFQIEDAASPRVHFPPLRAQPQHPGSLPLELTRFFGREEEIAQLQQWLQPVTTHESRGEQADSLPHPRLVTLTGPGGSGKTRLALEVARQRVGAFRGAVWFVPLADVVDAGRILDAVRDALRLPRAPDLDPMEQVVAVLAGQCALLVFDGYEHLLATGASSVWALLERAPTLTCLVTSRQRLDLAGEREYPVLPLPTPNGAKTPEQLAQCESVRLFVDRAQAVRPDFQITRANAQAVAALCRGLEGIPLALVLAAGRAQVLTPAQMLAHLESRFELLVSRRREGEARHRTLRATVDWSYQILSPELQRFFAGLSVFRGGWTLEAAEALCSGVQAFRRSGAQAGTGSIIDNEEVPLDLNARTPERLNAPGVLDYLEQLRECSLVVAEEAGEEVRYRLLETLREYGRERLREMGEAESLGRRHRDCFLALAERLETLTHGPDQRLLLERLEVEHDNLRAALEWCRTEGDGEGELRLAGALWKFWFGHGHLSEGQRRLTEALARGNHASPAVRLKALLGTGPLAYYQGDLEPAAASAAESLALARELQDSRGAALALNTLGSVAASRGDCEPATRLFEESLALSQGEGDRFGTALSWHQLGVVARHQGRVDEASQRLEASLALFRELGDTWGTALALETLGDLMLQTEAYERAARLNREVRDLAGQIGHPIGIAGSLRNLGLVATRQGEHDEAARLLHESLTLYRAIGSKHGIVRCLEGLAEVAGGQHHAARAVQLYGAAEALRGAVGATIQEADRAAYTGNVAAQRAVLGEEAFAAAWANGRAMTLEQVLPFALDHCPPGSRTQ